ncbi:flagellar motor control protein ZomB [Antrihabitans sp. YC2-6]|uniref:flagellar motor control protein ZomB n=1 Tax=Antrihabitans sp. YC2-6 TaxID=2799498 RepID=UPI0027DC9630|nr:flagellar motor control protein ZomB [Antrihabitans sp. YC2-6]
MSLSTSFDEASSAHRARRSDAKAVERSRAAADRTLYRAVFPAGIVVTALFFLWGGWERRWIADDGLIVLRTVRNLLAGNGPVFNMGERVETNTSAAWTYIVYAFSWLSQARLEYVVLTISLTLSVAAIVIGMIASATLYRARLSGSGGLLLVPAGALVYIALPPARDYASSGLESCLVIFWLALIFLLLVRWSVRPTPSVASTLILAFFAGLGPLVRPELVLISVLALGLVFLSPQDRWTVRAAMVVVAGAVPVGYQIWRMGYYALPYPNTAVAKDAAGSKWSQGFAYLWNLVLPYHLYFGVLVVAIGGAAVVWGSASRKSGRRAAAPAGIRERAQRVQSRLRAPGTVVGLILFSGALLLVYSLRVGGDFMHGRMLLPVVFCFLLPVAVLPLRVPERRSAWSSREKTSALVVAVAWVATLAWAFTIVTMTGSAAGTTIGKTGIVDERAYYVLNTGHEHPILAEDYLDYPRMRPMVEAIEETPNGGLLLNTPSFMYWDVVPPPLPIPEGGAGHTVYFLNLGMTSMNVPLDVRVLDPMGLAYPLAAHSDRLTDGRIGHDKSLYPDWVIADLGLVGMHPWLPSYLDEDWIEQARVALTCQETRDLLTSYRSELTFDRWKQNLKRALHFADYRFDRVPRYEIERCELIPPPKVVGGS